MAWSTPFRVAIVFLYATALCIAAFLLAKIYRKFRANRKKSITYLFILFLAGVLMLACFLVDRLFYEVLYDVFYGYAGGSICAMFFNIFLAFLATEIFLVKEDRPSRKVQLIRWAFVLILVISSTWEFAMFSQNLDATAPIVIVLGACYVFLVILGVGSYRLSRKVGDESFKRPFRHIGHFAFAYLGVSILLIGGYLVVALPGIFEVVDILTATTIIVAYYPAYIGIIKPMERESV